jgi:hypothetical protein
MKKKRNNQITDNSNLKVKFKSKIKRKKIKRQKLKKENMKLTNNQNKIMNLQIINKKKISNTIKKKNNNLNPIHLKNN